MIEGTVDSIEGFCSSTIKPDELTYVTLPALSTAFTYTTYVPSSVNSKESPSCQSDTLASSASVKIFEFGSSFEYSFA